MMKTKIMNAKKLTTSKIKDLAVKSNEAIADLVDVNGDGKIDKNDIGVIIEKKIKESDHKKFRPIFRDQVTTNPAIIKIVKEDKKRSENAICKGAVGYLKKLKYEDMLNIYDTHVDVIDAQFYPTLEKGVYLQNPYQHNLYIQQDEYFNYLKKACVNELEYIAQQLGAKYFKVSFSEQVSSQEQHKHQLGFGVPKGTKSQAAYERTHDVSSTSNTQVAAELEFDGHSMPTRPELVYFRNESDIEKLVLMRTQPETENKIKSKKYIFNCNSLSGISDNLAADVDVALRCSVINSENAFSKSKTNQRSTVLEYSIEF